MSWGTEQEETRLCWMNEVLTWTFVSNNHRPLVSNSDVLCLSVGESIHSEALHRGWWANARCKYAGTNGRSGRHIRGLTGCFLSQGMGMVVHQALTEYNRWDPVLAARQKRAFNDVANGARRLLVPSLWSDDTHECSISVLLGEKSRHFNTCSYLYLTLFFSRQCDFLFCFGMRQGLEIRMLFMEEVLSVCVHRRTHQSDGWLFHMLFCFLWINWMPLR